MKLATQLLSFLPFRKSLAAAFLATAAIDSRPYSRHRAAMFARLVGVMDFNRGIMDFALSSSELKKTIYLSASTFSPSKSFDESSERSEDDLLLFIIFLFLVLLVDFGQGKWLDNWLVNWLASFFSLAQLFEPMSFTRLFKLVSELVDKLVAVLVNKWLPLDCSQSWYLS